MILTRIADAASKYPDAIAIQFKEGDHYRKYSYRELIAAVARVARSFVRLETGKGDRVAILSENRPEWVIAYLAVTSIGAVVVPLDAQLTPKGLLERLDYTCMAKVAKGSQRRWRRGLCGDWNYNEKIAMESDRKD